MSQIRVSEITNPFFLAGFLAPRAIFCPFFRREPRLDEKIANIKGDEWQEMVYVDRVSFAVARKWIDRPYADAEGFIRSKPEEEFKKVTNFIFHDAVESVARIWARAWKRFIE